MKRFFVFLPLVLAVVCGCGGGGSSTTTNTQTADPEGIFTGTVNSTQAGEFTAYGVATPSGEFRYVASNDYLAMAAIASSSGILYSGSAGECSRITFTDVSVVADSSVSGNYTLSTGDTGFISFAYNSVYTRPQTLAALAGNYTSTTTTNSSIQDDLTLDDAGNISGVFTGTMVQIDPTKNLYRLTLTSIGKTFSGLAFWADPASGLTANSIYVQIAGTNNNPRAFGGVFKKN